ncbi:MULTISPECIES: PH domain-containing protein [Haloferax]|uniref:PH domain-containing protein n=2 Tax=Haloferax TaxID=2251 RepID=A0A6G1Z4Z1_9EURY|nr:MULTISPECIES: PH domain-containing protein [Haloferax]KAB1188983.1 PH domain-containing protein [Haloferax sp. CBA1149]MRW81707.1 PH domain-containing protein [Haloferax marinisediminis]
MNRLHPRIRLLWVARAVIFALVAGGVAAAAMLYTSLPIPVYLPVAISFVLLVVGVGYALLRYQAWGYEIRDDSLYLQRGVLTKVYTVVPYVRVQHVDSARGPLERLIGLASTIVYTAGSRGADVSIPGLTPDGAEDLQDRLKRLAIRAEGDDAV